jgi:hypothetical protein
MRLPRKHHWHLSIHTTVTSRHVTTQLKSVARRLQLASCRIWCTFLVTQLRLKEKATKRYQPDLWLVTALRLGGKGQSSIQFLYHDKWFPPMYVCVLSATCWPGYPILTEVIWILCHWPPNHNDIPRNSLKSVTPAQRKRKVRNMWVTTLPVVYSTEMVWGNETHYRRRHFLPQQCLNTK